MSMISDHLTKGGIPNGWTVHNLRWLAQAHRNLGQDARTPERAARTGWHRRWAALLEDILEAAREHRH